MLRIIKHVLDAKFRGLRIEPALTQLIWRLILLSDSNWATDKDGRKSVTGFMIFLNDVLICWRSVSQKVVALSSSEAEFYACSDACKEIPFIVQILEFLGIQVEKPIKVKMDNIGAIFMVKNTSTARSRHMDTRHFFVKDMEKSNLIKVEFTRSGDNTSDVQTKNVTGDIHDKHLETYTAEKSYLDEPESTNRKGVTEDVCGFSQESSLDTRQATGQVYPSRDTRQEMYCMDTEQDIDISVHAHEGSRVPGNVLDG